MSIAVGDWLILRKELVLVHAAKPGENDAVECPICNQYSRLCVSICPNKHWICYDCFERMVLRLEVVSFLQKTRICVPEDARKTCPLCRQGAVAIVRNVACNCAIPAGYLQCYSYEADVADRPITFRGHTYKSRCEAISAQFNDDINVVYESAMDPNLVINPATQTEQYPTFEHILRAFFEAHCMCDLCDTVLPGKQCQEHYFTVHAQLPKKDVYKMFPRRSIRQGILRQSQEQDH